MSQLTANGGLPLILLVGVVLLFAVGLVLNLRDPKNARHPDGPRGRLRDELMVLATFAPMLMIVLLGSLAGGLRDSAWWMPVFVTLAVLAAVGTFLPAVQRARKRIMALHRLPK